jgi:hypothetical protein
MSGVHTVKRTLSIDRDVSAEIDRISAATGRNASRVTTRLLVDGLTHNGIKLPDPVWPPVPKVEG